MTSTKDSRNITLTEEGMILRKRVEEILDLVKKTKNDFVRLYNSPRISPEEKPEHTVKNLSHGYTKDIFR